MSDFKKILGRVGCIIVVLIFFSVAAVAIGFNRGELSGWKPGSGNVGLCSNVPEPYKSIFDEAGKKWDVQPAFAAAIFYAGEHGNSWPEFAEHAALGTSLNPTPHDCGSDVGCIRGPMQIGERNWPNWTSGAYGGSKPLERIEWTRDAIYVATWHLAMTGAGGNTTNLDKLRDAASIYNSGRPWSIGQGIEQTAKYVPRVITAFQSFHCVQMAAAWIWPVTPPANWHSTFGAVDGLHPNGHTGIDIAVSGGTSVAAAKAGTVSRITIYNGNTYLHTPDPDPTHTPTANGNSVAIDHGNGYVSFYLHLKKDSIRVSAGDTVSQGQIIGEVDNTGHSTGDHLHFQINKDGTPIDPLGPDLLPSI